MPVKKINVSELSTNQVLARAVVNSNGNILMYEGARIRKENIQKLIKNNISEVFIEDNMLKDAKVYQIEEIEKQSVEIIKNIIETRINFDLENNEDVGIITETALSIIQGIISNVDISNCMLEVRRESDDLYTHMLSVTALSTIIGIKAGFSEMQLNDVAMGALLHDIGLCDVTVAFFDAEMDRMPAAEKLNYRRHVISGYERVQGIKWLNDTVKTIVLSHHERVDGSGYPFHKVADRIPPEVRLVSICDHLDEMVNGIGYKKRKIHEVVEYFRTDEAYLFDYDMTSQVMTTVAWFPNGTQVVTNDREVGVVISQNRGLPDRPVIKIIKTADGIDCSSKNIIKDLTECLTIFIVGTVE